MADGQLSFQALQYTQIIENGYNYKFFLGLLASSASQALKNMNMLVS